MTDNRWLAETGGNRGASYAERFRALAESGADIHGEARLVAELCPASGRVLDAGCGTGRVAIELDRRGFGVTGVDIDPSMLAVARRDAPHLRWVEADLATWRPADETYDVVVLAGNVLIYVAPGTERTVVTSCATRLAEGGLLITGFQLAPGGYGVADLDVDAEDAGLRLLHRWATWDREPYAGGDYAVSVHQRD